MKTDRTINLPPRVCFASAVDMQRLEIKVLQAIHGDNPFGAQPKALEWFEMPPKLKALDFGDPEKMRWTID